MGLFGVLLVAFFVAFVLQWFKRWAWLSVSVPAAGFVALILFDEIVLPYRGGGASMWPIALLFGVPTAILGSCLGLLFAALFQPDERGVSPD